MFAQRQGNEEEEKKKIQEWKKKNEFWSRGSEELVQSSDSLVSSQLTPWVKYTVCCWLTSFLGCENALLSSGSHAVTLDACRLIIDGGKHNYIALEINERIDRPL